MSGYVEDLWVKNGERTRRYGKGMRYRARYTDAHGRERCKSFPDRHKEDALGYAQAQATDVLRGAWTDPKSGRITLRQFIEATWLPLQGGSPATVSRIDSQLRNHVYPQLGGRYLSELADRPSLVAAWLRNLRQADSSKSVILGMLASIMGTAVDDSLISRNPCKARTVRAPAVSPRELVPWQPAVIAAVRAGLPARWQAMTDCGADLGLRQGEALGLALDAIDFLRREVRVIRQLRNVRGALHLALPKGAKTRTVPLPASTALALAAHVERFPPVAVRLPWGEPGGDLLEVRLLFTTPSGRAIRAGGFDEYHWKPSVKAAGLPGTRADGFHMLRHTYASELLAGGEDIVTVARHLGHAKPTTTLAVYGHFIPGREDRTRKIIDSRAETDPDRTGDLGSGSAAGQD